MYQSKPINPEVFRLANAARMLLESINAGELQAIDGKEGKATEVADALQRALSDITNTYPDQVSPFLRYRKEIMGDYTMAGHLRDLVVHLWWHKCRTNLKQMLECADPHHTRIVLELIESYCRNGDRDESFMSMAYEILNGRTASDIDRFNEEWQLTPPQPEEAGK